MFKHSYVRDQFYSNITTLWHTFTISQNLYLFADHHESIETAKEGQKETSQTKETLVHKIHE